MDISFDIHNNEGDHLRVALSYYDIETLSLFTSDPSTLCLTFYDITLIRMAGTNYVGYRVLSTVSDILARFLDENPDAVLCYYCDDKTDIKTSHNSFLPQEYRSKLFSRMFDSYMKSHSRNDFIDHTIEVYVDGQPKFAHFICRSEHIYSVSIIGDQLLSK